MSSSEGENFDLEDVSGSESEDYAPVTKKAGHLFTSLVTVQLIWLQAKAPAKVKDAPKVTKSVPKPELAVTKAKAKAVTKKKILVDHNDNAEDSSMDVDVGNDVSDHDEPSTSAQKVRATGPGKKKTVSETYTKVSITRYVTHETRSDVRFVQLSQIDHILKRPDAYIGNIEAITQTMWTYDSDTKRMVYRDVKYVPGFFKIVDEILVNAADNKVGDTTPIEFVG